MDCGEISILGLGLFRVFFVWLMDIFFRGIKGRGVNILGWMFFVSVVIFFVMGSVYGFKNILRL